MCAFVSTTSSFEAVLSIKGKNMKNLSWELQRDREIAKHLMPIGRSVFHIYSHKAFNTFTIRLLDI
jgi:hypothetical protein